MANTPSYLRTEVRDASGTIVAFSNPLHLTPPRLGGAVSVLVIEHEADASLGRFQPWLSAAGGRSISGARPPGTLPTDLTGYAGLVVLGGSPRHGRTRSRPGCRPPGH